MEMYATKHTYVRFPLCKWHFQCWHHIRVQYTHAHTRNESAVVEKWNHVQHVNRNRELFGGTGAIIWVKRKRWWRRWCLFILNIFKFIHNTYIYCECFVRMHKRSSMLHALQRWVEWMRITSSWFDEKKELTRIEYADNLYTNESTFITSR